MVALSLTVQLRLVNSPAFVEAMAAYTQRTGDCVRAVQSGLAYVTLQQSADGVFLVPQEFQGFEYEPQILGVEERTPEYAQVVCDNGGAKLRTFRVVDHVAWFVAGRRLAVLTMDGSQSIIHVVTLSRHASANGVATAYRLTSRQTRNGSYKNALRAVREKWLCGEDCSHIHWGHCMPQHRVQRS